MSPGVLRSQWNLRGHLLEGEWSPLGKDFLKGGARKSYFLPLLLSVWACVLGISYTIGQPCGERLIHLRCGSNWQEKLGSLRMWLIWWISQLRTSLPLHSCHRWINLLRFRPFGSVANYLPTRTLSLTHRVIFIPPHFPCLMGTISGVAWRNKSPPSSFLTLVLIGHISFSWGWTSQVLQLDSRDMVVRSASTLNMYVYLGQWFSNFSMHPNHANVG